MCGIAGLIYKKNKGCVGRSMTSMLQSMKHRGPDSTGFAVYGLPEEGKLVMRLKVAERKDLDKGFDIRDQIKQRKAEVNRRILELGGEIATEHQATEYAWLFRLRYDGDLRKLADYIEDIEGTDILSIGTSLELFKDLGDANAVSSLYELDRFEGTHAIGHVRMATESDVDICSAHPYWAYPLSDISVVHNGQLTNYWSFRRSLERKGYRFVSDCDSELIAVYIAEKLESGASLEEAMHQSVNELDGVFTYLVATREALGMAKDMMSAKPMVLYEGEDVIALASEEIAIRAIVPHEIDTVDPYAGEVHSWHIN